MFIRLATGHPKVIPLLMSLVFKTDWMAHLNWKKTNREAGQIRSPFWWVRKYFQEHVLIKKFTIAKIWFSSSFPPSIMGQILCRSLFMTLEASSCSCVNDLQILTTGSSKGTVRSWINMSTAVSTLCVAKCRIIVSVCRFSSSLSMLWSLS